MPPEWRELIVAANRHAVCGLVARWIIHDLRNPVQALTLLTGILDDAGTSEASAAETLRSATAQATRSIELLDRLLARADAVAPGPVSLLESLQFIALVYGARHRPVLLEIDWPRANRLPAVRGVSSDIELVLLNLVLNSLEALRGRASGRILVETSVRGAAVQISLSDNGCGIRPDVEARMFEPFLSGWNGRAAAGLGLAASRIIMERFGGTLVHAPGPEPGARFILDLPAIGLEGDTPA